MKRSVYLAAALIPALVIVVLAVPGVLDTTFGLAGTGKVTTGLGTGLFHQQANDLAVDADDTIVVIGTVAASAGLGNIGVVRYGDIGHPFFSVVTDLHGDETATAVAIDSAGRIVVVGSTNNTCLGACDHGYDFYVARFTPNGSLDTSFAGGTGWRQIDIGSASDLATDVAIDALGRIVVAGTTAVHGNNGDYDVIALARLLPNGDRDTAFDGDGAKSVSLGTNVDVAVNGLVVHASGGLVLAGRAGSAPAVIRLQEIGDLYQFFSNDGVATAGFGCAGEFRDIAIDGWQRIVVTGECLEINTSRRSIVAARFLGNGQLDSAFGGGFVSMALGTFATRGGTDVAVDALGRVTIAGYVHECDLDFVLLRLQPDGTLDPHFGDANQGWTITNFGSGTQCSSEQAHGLAIDNKGRYVVAGRTFNIAHASNEFALARYLGDQQDFTVSVAPITVVPGSAASTTVTVTSIDGFNELLKFVVYPTQAGGPLPAGFTQTSGVSIFPVPFGTATETWTVDVASFVAPGTYTFWLIEERFRDHAAPVVINVVTSLPLMQNTIAQYTANGYIKNARVENVLLTMLLTADAFAARGQIRAAENKYASTINYISAQAGPGIATSAEENGVTFDPSQVLMNLVAGLASQLTN